jgi:hypothetical protein
VSQAAVAGMGRRLPGRRPSADAAFHSIAMVLMIVGMVATELWIPVLLAALWFVQAVAAVLLRSGWRVQGSFVDLIAVSASLAVPLAVDHGHGGAGGSAVMAVAGVAAVWLLARWSVGVRGREWIGFVAMAASMLVMIVWHAVQTA